MTDNNPATSGSILLSTTSHNSAMVKECTGGLSRMRRIDELSGGRLPFCAGSNPLVLDALRAGAAGVCTAARCRRLQPCIDVYDEANRWRIANSTSHLHRAQARARVHRGRRGGHHSRGRVGVDRSRSRGSARTTAALGPRQPSEAAEDIDKYLIAPLGKVRLSGLRPCSRARCLNIGKKCRCGLNVFGSYQLNARVRDLRFTAPLGPRTSAAPKS